jgi:hypothetical protein
LEGNSSFLSIRVGSCGPVLVLELSCHATETSLRIMSFNFLI